MLGGLEEVADIRTENERRIVDCPTMERMFVNNKKSFAKFVLEAASHEETVGSLMTLQWAWVRRKTKQDTEERNLQEAGQRVFNALQNALYDTMDDRGWKQAATEFGEAVKPLCEMLDALETDVNVENYPRVMYEAGRQKEEATGHLEEEQEQPTMGQQMNGGGEGTGRRGRGNDAREARRGHGRQTTEGMDARRA